MSRWTEESKQVASTMLSEGHSVDDISLKTGMSRSSVISLKYSISDSGERVKCKICKCEMKQITVKHLNEHNISFEEYKTQYPNAPTSTEKRLKIYQNFKSPNKGKTYEIIYGDKEAKIKKNKISQNQIGRPCPKLAGTGISGTRKDTGTFARSTYESNIDRIFILENKKYADETFINATRFDLIKKNGEKITYCPDRIDEEGLFHKGAYLEIKGYMHPDDWEKIQLFREQYKNKKLLVICKDKSYFDIDYRELEKKYKNRILLWEGEKQNYRTRPDLYVIGYKTPEHLLFYQKNYPNHINSNILDQHLTFIANKCLSFNRVSLGLDPYIEHIELIAISNRRQGSSRQSSGEYNYELWKITTTENNAFYITNQDKTTLFYCYEESDLDRLTPFFANNNIERLKYGRKNNKTQEYIDKTLWESSDEHKKHILQLINDRMKHKAIIDNRIVVDIILNKTEKSKSGSLYNYEEWLVCCEEKHIISYKLTNFGNSTAEFKLLDINTPSED